MSPCRVTVLLPVWNGQDYIAESLSSILTQSLEDFDVLVFDDGSTDSTPAILAGFNDPRVRVIRSPVNRGLVATLNHGLEIIDTSYIARMDADDIADRDRLKTEKAFLDSQPEIGVVGSAVSLVGDGTVWPYPESDSAIRVAMLHDSPFAHPTVMYRADLIRKCRYDALYLHAEDFNLWVDLCDETKFANLPSPYLKSRRHAGQISSIRSKEQFLTHTTIIAKYIGKIFGGSVPDADLHAHNALIGNEPMRDIDALDSWIGKLRGLPHSRTGWEREDLEFFVADRLFRRLKDESNRRLSRRLSRRLKRIFS